MAKQKRICELLVAFGLVTLACKYDPHPKSGSQACASGSKQCPNGYVCSGGLCRLPNDIPSPDASGPSGTGSDTTTGTRTETNTSTATCGGLNRACCANNECTALGTVCNGLTCVACGITGRPCCANRVCPGAGSICNAEGNCVVCGSSGYVCCANNTCIGDTICSLGSCVPCGGAVNQPCCTGNLCGATLACIGGTCQHPTPDGGISTSTGTTTARDAAIDIGTGTFTGTATVTVRDAGNDAATNTSTGTTTTTRTKADAGIDASTSTGIIITIPHSIITTGIATGVLPPMTAMTTTAPSAH